MAASLQSYLRARPPELAKGPIAIVLFEDFVETETTLVHLAKAGFGLILALSPEPLPAKVLAPSVRNLIFGTRHPEAHVAAVNAVIDAVPQGIWMYYGYNAEYLFYPFSDSRTVGEMLAFHTEERRSAMLSYVVDLYASDLKQFPNGVDVSGAMFDKTGYYALGRLDAEGHQIDRQLDFHGGLRWRFEEFIPENRRRIDRISLFRTAPDLRLLPDHRFNIEEYNTYSCPWHHSLTCAVASFRVAKALASNPGSRGEIPGFTWRNSTSFGWTAQELMDLGLMEPGQWF